MAKFGSGSVHTNDVALHEGKLVAGPGEAAPGRQEALVAELQGDCGIAVEPKVPVGPSPGAAEMVTVLAKGLLDPGFGRGELEADIIARQLL